MLTSSGCGFDRVQRALSAAAAAAVEPWQCTGMYHHQPSTSHRHPSGSKSIANKCTSVPIIIVIVLFVTIIIIVQWGCISWAINYFTIRFNYNTPVSRAAAANWPGMCFRVSHYSQVRPGTWISWRDDGWLELCTMACVTNNADHHLQPHCLLDGRTTKEPINYNRSQEAVTRY